MLEEASLRHASPVCARRSLPYWLGSLFLSFAYALLAPAQAQVPVAGESASGEVAQFFLQARKAARDSDYSGVFAYQQGDNLQSSLLVHVVDGTGERERLVALDGEPREFIRHNDQVHYLMPHEKLVLIERRGIERFPGVLLGDGRALDIYYTLQAHDELQRVAGHKCQFVEVLPQDNLRYGYRFCMEPKSKLLIQAQTINRQGRMVNQIAFTSLKQGTDVNAQELQSPWDIKGWKTIKDTSSDVLIADQGWRMTLPAGFQSVAQISRNIKSGKNVVQMVLSDGLAAISVFIEQIQSSNNIRQMPKGPGHNGTMNVYGARIADYWLTAVGEVPIETLQELIEHAEYVPPGVTLQ